MIKVSQAGTIVGGVVNFTVTVELTNADELVKPGMTAAVNIVVKEINDAVLVPNRAVRLVDGNRVVYVTGEDGMPEKVEIRLGASSDTMSVVVGGDLQEGDQIILNPPAEFQGRRRTALLGVGNSMDNVIEVRDMTKVLQNGRGRSPCLAWSLI